MKARDPYQLALSALVGFAGSGRFGWGEPLIATSLAMELGLSATPIREALARLAGEGLIEHRPGRGYYALSPTTTEVSDLYELHRRLVSWALDQTAVADFLARADVVSPKVEALYDRVVGGAGSRILSRAHRRVVLQLRPIRAVEDRLGLLGLDAVQLQEAQLEAGDLEALARTVNQYHADRKAGASVVVAALRRSVERIDEI